MSKFNLEGRSSVPDVDLRDAYKSVDPFASLDPLLAKSRQDWLNYINTRPAIDEDGNVYDPETGQPIEVNMEMDRNRRYYNDVYDATIHEGSRENMRLDSLAHLANEAYLRGDKTMLADLEDEIIKKLADVQEKNHLSQELIDTYMEKLNSIVYAGTPVGSQDKEPTTHQPASQEPDPTGNHGQGKQPAGGNGTKEPVTARGVAEKLNADGEEFSLDALQKALEDNDQSLEPKKKKLLDRLKGRVKDFAQGTGEVVKGIWKPVFSWFDLTRTATRNVIDTKPEDFATVAEYKKAKRDAVIAAMGPYAIAGFVAVVGVALVKTAFLVAPAGRAAGLVAEGLGDDSIDPSLVDAAQSADVAGVDSGHGDFSPMGWGNYDDDMSLQAGSDTGDAGVMFNHDPSIDVGPHGYDISLDPFFAPDKGPEWNMSNGFITNGTPAEAMDDWMKDLFKSPEMMSMFAAESGMEGADDPTTLDDLLTNSPNDYISWSDRIKEMLDQATDVHYETIPAGKEYNTWYTQIDNNGDPQLVQSFGISHDKDVTALVFSIKGENYMVNSDCGQLVRYEPTVYDNVPIFNPSDQPGGQDTPPAQPGTPGEQGTPPAQPGTPEEQTPQEPNSKDPTVGANVNSDLSGQVQMGDQAGTGEVNSATGGDTEPSEQPGATYVPPAAQAEGTGQQTPQSEQRQEQADQGVDTGDGNQSNSGTVSTN